MYLCMYVYNVCLLDETMDELLRLSTFKNFPAINGFYPTHLAAAGFEYTGKNDEIRCTGCALTLRSLSSFDDVTERHKLSSRHCPFIVDSTHTRSGNTNQSRSQIIEVDGHNFSNSSSPSNQRRRCPSGDTAKSLLLDNEFLSLQPTQTNINKNSLASLRYARSRLGTFARWSKSDVIKPESLANAGFIYTDIGDTVKCVFCEGNLRTWEATDDPMKRHAKNFPLCAFISGREVGNVPLESLSTQNNYSTKIMPSPYHSDIAVDGPGLKVLSKNNYTMDPREIKARLDTPQVRKVLAMGFSMDLIRTVIDERLRSHGDDFPNLTSFVQALTRK